MENKEVLNEEKYNNAKKKVERTAIVILIVGLLLGLGVISIGLYKQSKINEKFSDKSKEVLTVKINEEKQKLQAKRDELIAKGVEDRVVGSIYEGENYDLRAINRALDPSFPNCEFDEFKNYSLTSNYCSLVNQLKHISSDSKKNYEMSQYIPFYIVGGFIMVVTLMLFSSIYLFTKRREITAFTVQQVMPIAQEGIEKMAPTIGKAESEIIKNVAPTIRDSVAPVIGDIAEEITKGVKKGLKGDKK